MQPEIDKIEALLRNSKEKRDKDIRPSKLEQEEKSLRAASGVSSAQDTSSLSSSCVRDILSDPSLVVLDIDYMIRKIPVRALSWICWIS